MFISPEVGGGVIREDVQEAVQRELNYRLGKGDAPGALSRAEKELALMAINEQRMNNCLSQLHGYAAIKAGATVEQVLEVSLVNTLTGMPRWKAAAMWAVIAAEEAAKESGLEGTKKDSEIGEQRIKEINEYVGQVLPYDSGSIDMWAKLAEVAPVVWDGYIKMRSNIIKYEPPMALPKRKMELVAFVAIDVLIGNVWGAQMHARQAIRDGATVPEVVETAALVMIEAGVTTYKTGGLDAIEAAEDEAAKLQGQR